MEVRHDLPDTLGAVPEQLTLKLTASPSLAALADVRRHPLWAWTADTPLEPWGRLMTFWSTPVMPVWTVRHAEDRDPQSLVVEVSDYRVVDDTGGVNGA